MATKAELLADAENKYHQVLTGQAVRVFVDQNGERVEYTVANAGRLLAYIKSLGGPSWVSGNVSGPMRILM